MSTVFEELKICIDEATRSTFPIELVNLMGTFVLAPRAGQLHFDRRTLGKCNCHTKEFKPDHVVSGGCNWNCSSCIASLSPLEHKETFTVGGEGRQMAILITSDPFTNAARFNPFSVGFYLDAGTMHHGDEANKELAELGFNQKIRLTRVDNFTTRWDRMSQQSICLDRERNCITYTLKSFGRVRRGEFALPPALCGVPLFAGVGVWNGCSAHLCVNTV